MYKHAFQKILIFRPCHLRPWKLTKAHKKTMKYKKQIQKTRSKPKSSTNTFSDKTTIRTASRTAKNNIYLQQWPKRIHVRSFVSAFDFVWRTTTSTNEKVLTWGWGIQCARACVVHLTDSEFLRVCMCVCSVTCMCVVCLANNRRAGIKHKGNNILKHTRYEPWERRSQDDNVGFLCYVIIVFVVMVVYSLRFASVATFDVFAPCWIDAFIKKIIHFTFLYGMFLLISKT